MLHTWACPQIRVLPPRQVKDPLAWDILVPKPNKKWVVCEVSVVMRPGDLWWRLSGTFCNGVGGGDQQHTLDATQPGGGCLMPLLSCALPPHRVQCNQHLLTCTCIIMASPCRAVAYTHSFPWELKADRAVWRGTRWCDRGAPHHMVS